MLTQDLINNNIPRLTLQDNVAKALQLMEDFRLSHLPVVDGALFMGLLSEEDLLDLNLPAAKIELLREHFISAFVPANVHFLNAVTVSIKHDTNIVAVTNSGRYLGAIPNFDLLKKLGNFAGADEIGGLIELQMDWNHFHLSEISRIVESNDCTILHLNSTLDGATGNLTVTLHLNKRDIYALVATFHRYEYNVTYALGREEFEKEITDNYKNLMHFIEL